MSKARTEYRRLGEDCRSRGIAPPPNWCDPDKVDSAGRAFLDGWLGDSWRRRLFGTNFCRVLILPEPLLVLADRREDLFARSAA